MSVWQTIDCMQQQINEMTKTTFLSSFRLTWDNKRVKFRLTWDKNGPLKIRNFIIWVFDKILIACNNKFIKWRKRLSSLRFVSRETKTGQGNTEPPHRHHDNQRTTPPATATTAERKPPQDTTTPTTSDNNDHNHLHLNSNTKPQTTTHTSWQPQNNGLT
jgi:hypothetical protein